MSGAARTSRRSAHLSPSRWGWTIAHLGDFVRLHSDLQGPKQIADISSDALFAAVHSKGGESAHHHFLPR